MDFKKLVNDYKNEAFMILSKLISFESVLDEYKENSDAPFGIENKKALEYLLSKAEEDGFVVKNVDNYAGHVEFGSGKEILGVLAHLDVVPVNPTEWDTYPFSLVVKEDKMYARGVLDDKGPLVASYIAMKMLKDNGFKPKRRIRLIAGCDEESGSRCLERYLEKEEKPQLGFSPDAGFPLIYGEKGILSYDIKSNSGDNVIEEFICGERYNVVPSEAKAKLNINLDKEFTEFINSNSYKGEIKDGYYVIYGKAAHAMCPEEGINAAYILFDFINKYSDSKLAKFMDKYLLNDTLGKKMGYDIYDEEMKELTSNFAFVRVNNSSIRLGVNCRIPVDSQQKVLKDCIDKASAEFGYYAEIVSAVPRHYVSPKSELVEKLMKVYKEVVKDDVNGPITIGGGTYAREIGNAVAYGPVLVGREDVCHIANEYMYIEDFLLSIEVYANAIYELTK